MPKLSRNALLKIRDYANLYDSQFASDAKDQDKVQVDKNGKYSVKCTEGELRSFSFNFSEWINASYLAIRAKEKGNGSAIGQVNTQWEKIQQDTWSIKEVKRELGELKKYKSEVDKAIKENKPHREFYVKEEPRVNDKPRDFSKLSKEEIQQKINENNTVLANSYRENSLAKVGLYSAARRAFDGKPLWKKLLRPISSLIDLSRLHQLRDDICDQTQLTEEQLNSVADMMANPDPKRMAGMDGLDEKGKPIPNNENKEEYKEPEKIQHDLQELPFENEIGADPDTERDEDLEIFKDNIYKEFGTKEHIAIKEAIKTGEPVREIAPLDASLY